MTPQERQLIDELFERLASLENSPRDPDAERAIIEGLRRAPHAPYAMVQTVLVQDEALKRANARIEELEAGPPEAHEPPRGFLDNMRDTLFGREERRGSVPSVRPGGQGTSGVWGAGPNNPNSPPPPPPPGYGSYGGGPEYAPGPQYGAGPGSGGGSFLGTAAASAAGVIGGAMLLNSIKSMFGPSHGSASASAFNPGSSAGSPWGGGGAGSASNSELAREAGIDNIGGSRSAARDDDGGRDTRSGLFGGKDDEPGHQAGRGGSPGGDDNADHAGFFGGNDEHTDYDAHGDEETDFADDFDGDDSDNA
jgi:hypothetical protein